MKELGVILLGLAGGLTILFMFIYGVTLIDPTTLCLQQQHMTEFCKELLNKVDKRP